MARSFLTAINLNKNELQNAAVQNLGSAPASPVKGQLYYNSTGGDDTLYWWNGSQWIAAKAAAGAIPAATVTTQAVGDAAVVGVSTNYAREDHKHGREAFGTITAETTMGAVKSDGVATTVARSDHQHGNPSTSGVAPTGLIQPGATAAPGSNNQPSRADHVHGWGAALAALDMGGFPITNVAAPTGVNDAANKNYVDNAVAGLSWKDSVRLATAGTNLVYPYSGNGQLIDGLNTNTGDRILMKDQPTASQNGIWVVASGTWARATDADINTEIEGMAVFVEEGTANGDTAWVCTNNMPITVGTTNLTFVQFAGGGSVVAGAGMTQSGNTLNVIATNGSLTVGADDIQVGYAGTGGNNGSAVTAARSDHLHSGTYVAVAGDTMTGALTVSGSGIRVNVPTGTVQAATFAALNGGLTGNSVNLSGSGASLIVGGSSSSADFTNLAAQVVLPAITPTLTNHAVPKSYVDGNFVPTSRQVIAGAGLITGGALSGNVTLDVGAGTGITVTANAIGVDGGTVPYWSTFSYAQNVGGATAQVINHALLTQDVIVDVYRNSAPFDTVDCDVERTDINNVTLRFATAPASNAYRVVVMAKAF